MFPDRLFGREAGLRLGVVVHSCRGKEPPCVAPMRLLHTFQRFPQIRVGVAFPPGVSDLPRQIPVLCAPLEFLPFPALVDPEPDPVLGPLVQARKIIHRRPLRHPQQYQRRPYRRHHAVSPHPWHSVHVTGTVVPVRSLRPTVDKRREVTRPRRIRPRHEPEIGHRNRRSRALVVSLGLADLRPSRSLPSARPLLSHNRRSRAFTVAANVFDRHALGTSSGVRTSSGAFGT